MDQRFAGSERPSLEDVRQRFEQWRERKRRGAPIPNNLWESAVRLGATHSLCTISRSLRLDYNGLKRRVRSSRPENLLEPLTASGFVELELPASVPDAEYILEMERGGGKMRMQIKGATSFQALEWVKAFWGQR